MKGDAKVIEYLNSGLRSELTAVSQFWLHYRWLDNWGLNALAKKWREELIEEMRHADRFIDRIIFLGGFPNLQLLNPLRIGQSVNEIMDADLDADPSLQAAFSSPVGVRSHIRPAFPAVASRAGIRNARRHRSGYDGAVRNRARRCIAP